MRWTNLSHELEILSYRRKIFFYERWSSLNLFVLQSCHLFVMLKTRQLSFLQKIFNVQNSLINVRPISYFYWFYLKCLLFCMSVFLYCRSKKCCQCLYSEMLHKNGQHLLDNQYVYLFVILLVCLSRSLLIYQ